VEDRHPACFASVCGHVAAQVVFLSHSAPIAIALLIVDGAVLFDLIAPVGDRCPRF
jgi:hypothetical protein